jgi:DNA polymerase-3 subunit delta
MTDKSKKHTLIAGSDEFAVKEQTALMLKKLAPEDPMNFEVIDAQVDSIDNACKQLDSAVEALLTLPFLGGSKLVHFKNCNFLTDSPAGKNDEVTSRLARLIEVLNKVPPGDAQLVVSAVGVDKRKSFYKQFEKLGAVYLYDLPDIKGARGEAEWCREIERVMKQAGLKPQPGVAERLMEMIGNDRRALNSEIEKLALYSHPHGNIEEEDLKLVVAATRELLVWDLLDATVSGNSADAVHMLRQLLAQNESEVGILILLAGQIRLAAIGTHLLETNRLRLRKSGTFVNLDLTPEADELLPVSKKGEKPNAFRLAKAVDQARKKPAKKWFEALDVLYNTNLQLVSSASDPEKTLETAIIRICQL